MLKITNLIHNTNPELRNRKFSSKPTVLVLHYTADSGRFDGTTSDAVGSHRVLNNRGLSAHFCQSRTGEFIQCLPLDVRGSHAGRSKWKGRQWVNNFSIGVEISNAGWLNKNSFGESMATLRRETNNIEAKYPGITFWREGSDGRKQTREFNIDEVIIGEHRNSPGWVVAWEKFTDEQMAALKEFVPWLDEELSGSIEDIVGHDHISPNRKSDPGPYFTDGVYQELRSLLGDFDPDFESDIKNKYIVTARSGLRVRSIPSLSGDIVTTLPADSIVSLSGDTVSNDGIKWVAVDKSGDGRVDGYAAFNFLRPRV